MRLSLVLEEPFVPLLAKARRGIDHKLCKRTGRNLAIFGQVVPVFGRPVGRRTVRLHLEQDQVIQTVKVRRHFHQCLPVQALVIDTDSAPTRLVLEHLIEQRRDSRTRFTRSGIASNQPASAEILPCPRKSTETDDHLTGSSTATDQQSSESQNTQGYCPDDPLT